MAKTITFKKSKGTLNINLGTSVTLDELEKADDFFNQTEKIKNIHFISQQIDNIDISGIQYIQSILSYAQANNLKTKLDLKFSDTQNNILNNCGFNFLTSKK